MASRGANNCMRMFLVIVNLLFLLMGIAILGVGIYMCTDAVLAKYYDLVGVSTLRSLRFVLIGCGALVTLIGMCGCFGACKENLCLLKLYLLFLFLVLFINLAALILSVVYNNKVKTIFAEQIRDRVKRLYSNSTDKDSKAFTELIDMFQRKEFCCGWSGPGSKQNLFISSPWYHDGNEPGRPQFPESCCAPGVLEVEQKKKECLNPTNEEKSREKEIINKKDCMEILIDQNGFFVRAVLVTVVLAILLQILCIVCGVVITRQISGGGAGRVV